MSAVGCSWSYSWAERCLNWCCKLGTHKSHLVWYVFTTAI